MENVQLKQTRGKKKDKYNEQRRIINMVDINSNDTNGLNAPIQ